MCGRYGFTPGDDFYERFDVENRLERLDSHYNVAPGYDMPVITGNSHNRVTLMRWGLIPFWAKDPKIGYRMINARAESLKEKPAFRKPLRSQRCIVPASGFYEWKKLPDERLPYYIKPKKDDMFALAGLFDTWTDEDGHEIKSYTIITTGPNDILVPIHNRMPAILDKKNESVWLGNDGQDIDKIISVLKPYPDNRMEAYPVSKMVNSPANDSREVISPVPEKPLQEKLID